MLEVEQGIQQVIDGHVGRSHAQNITMCSLANKFGNFCN